MRNTSVKLFCIWTNGSVGDVVERYFLSRALTALLFSRANLVMGDTGLPLNMHFKIS